MYIKLRYYDHIKEIFLTFLYKCLKNTLCLCIPEIDNSFCRHIRIRSRIRNFRNENLYSKEKVQRELIETVLNKANSYKVVLLAHLIAFLST